MSEEDILREPQCSCNLGRGDQRTHAHRLHPQESNRERAAQPNTEQICSPQREEPDAASMCPVPDCLPAEAPDQPQRKTEK